DRQSPLRAKAALRYVLQELSDDGHCGYPEEAVIDKTVELTSIAREVGVAQVTAGVKDDGLVREPWKDRGDSQPWLYLKNLFLAEAGVARQLRQLCAGPHPLPTVNADAALGWVEQQMGLELAPTQKEAIRKATQNKTLVITGGPGVGKTTIVRGLL